MKKLFSKSRRGSTTLQTPNSTQHGDAQTEDSTMGTCMPTHMILRRRKSSTNPVPEGNKDRSVSAPPSAPSKFFSYGEHGFANTAKCDDGAILLHIKENEESNASLTLKDETTGRSCKSTLPNIIVSDSFAKNEIREIGNPSAECFQTPPNTDLTFDLSQLCPQRPSKDRIKSSTSPTLVESPKYFDSNNSQDESPETTFDSHRTQANHHVSHEETREPEFVNAPFDIATGKSQCDNEHKTKETSLSHIVLGSTELEGAETPSFGEALTEKEPVSDNFCTSEDGSDQGQADQSDSGEQSNYFSQVKDSAFPLVEENTNDDGAGVSEHDRQSLEYPDPTESPILNSWVQNFEQYIGSRDFSKALGKLHPEGLKFAEVLKPPKKESTYFKGPCGGNNLISQILTGCRTVRGSSETLTELFVQELSPTRSHISGDHDPTGYLADASPENVQAPVRKAYGKLRNSHPVKLSGNCTQENSDKSYIDSNVSSFQDNTHVGCAFGLAFRGQPIFSMDFKTHEDPTGYLEYASQETYEDIIN